MMWGKSSVVCVVTITKRSESAADDRLFARCVTGLDLTTLVQLFFQLSVKDLLKLCENEYIAAATYLEAGYRTITEGSQ
jgi:hypothetical protein